MIKCRYEGTGVWAERCLGTKEVDPCPGYEKCNRYKPDGLTNGSCATSGKIVMNVRQKAFATKGTPACRIGSNSPPKED